MNGGDPDRMTLRRFVDAGYTLLVEEYTRLGINLLEAVETVSKFGTGDAAPVQSRTASQNDQSMQTLMGMMAGVER